MTLEELTYKKQIIVKDDDGEFHAYCMKATIIHGQECVLAAIPVIQNGTRSRMAEINITNQLPEPNKIGYINSQAELEVFKQDFPTKHYRFRGYHLHEVSSVDLTKEEMIYNLNKDVNGI